MYIEQLPIHFKFFPIHYKPLHIELPVQITFFLFEMLDPNYVFLNLSKHKIKPIHILRVLYWEHLLWERRKKLVGALKWPETEDRSPHAEEIELVAAKSLIDEEPILPIKCYFPALYCNCLPLCIHGDLVLIVQFEIHPFRRPHFKVLPRVAGVAQIAVLTEVLVEGDQLIYVERALEEELELKSLSGVENGNLEGESVVMQLTCLIPESSEFDRDFEAEKEWEKRQDQEKKFHFQ